MRPATRFPFSYRAALILSGLVLAACDFAPPVGGRTPTPAPTDVSILATTPPPTPSLTPTAPVTVLASPTPVLPGEALLESPTPTHTPGPPTQTFTPSPTPGPWEYVIQPGDTLFYIIQLPPFNYRDTNVVNEILVLNPNITSIDRLPPAGSTILIPRPTATPTPEGFVATQAAFPGVAVAQADVTTGEVVQHTVREGETILGVAGSNATTLSVLATLNPDLSFFGCDFSNPSGGPDCNVPLVIGQQVNVPALTPTPTLSPTFSGSETPTPTPTYEPPQSIFPSNNANASARTFQLQWLSAGILAPNEVYIVQIEDRTTGASHTGVTRTTSYVLPEDMVPTDGRPHEIRWRVAIGVPNDQGAYRIISGEGPWRTFTWQSR